MMLALESSIASMRNDAHESTAPRSLELALRRMGFAARRSAVFRIPETDSTWESSSPVPAVLRSRRSCPSADDPALDWRPL